MTLRYLLPAFVLTACAAEGVASAETKDAPPVEAPAFDRAAMDALLSDAVETGDVIGVSALVFDEGEVVYRNAFGLADRENELPVTDDSVWRIYSMTKPVMSAVIMDLVEEGQLGLQDAAADYIPALANMKVVSLDENGVPQYEDQARPMTVEDLLLHRSGMSYGIFGGSPVEEAYQQANLFAADEPLAPKMERLGQLPLVAQPGAVWMYSYSIDVLGRIAEVVTGQPLDDIMAERIFEPLGMRETGFYVRPDQADRFVAVYEYKEDGTYQRLEESPDNVFLPGFMVDDAFHSGGGGLVSTLGDYAKFSEMILNEGALGDVRVLEPETVRLMMQNHMEEGFTSFLPWLGGETGIGFGYGGSVVLSATEEQQMTTGRYVGQWGWGGAARTNMFIDPANDSFGIIMLQFFSPEDPQLHADFRVLTLKETRDE